MLRRNQFLIAQPKSPARFEIIRKPRHGFCAPCQDAARIADQNRLVGQRDRFHSRSAGLVHGEGRHFPAATPLPREICRAGFGSAARLPCTLPKMVLPPARARCQRAPGQPWQRLCPGPRLSAKPMIRRICQSASAPRTEYRLPASCYLQTFESSRTENESGSRFRLGRLGNGW